MSLGGVVPPPSNQSKGSNAQAYSYVAAQQMADYDSLARGEGKHHMK